MSHPSGNQFITQPISHRRRKLEIRANAGNSVTKNPENLEFDKIINNFTFKNKFHSNPISNINEN